MLRAAPRPGRGLGAQSRREEMGEEPAAPPTPAVALHEHVELPASPKLCFENLPAGKPSSLAS